MRSLWKRIADLEVAPRIAHRPPRETPEAREAKESFRGAVGALRERAGAERVDHSDDDPVVGELAREAREKFRRYIRVTRSGAKPE